MKILHDSYNLYIAQFDKICYYKMKKWYVDEQVAIDSIDEKLSVVKHEHYAFMDYRNVKKADFMAMKVLTEDMAYEGILASALLLSGGLGALLGDIYLNMKKPSYPFDYFTNPNGAAEWMQQFCPGTLPQFETLLIEQSQI